MMRLVPLKDLDPFISIRSSTKGPRPLNLSPVEDSPSPSGDHHLVGPPKQNKRKRELASLMADASSIRAYHILSPQFNLIYSFFVF